MSTNGTTYQLEMLQISYYISMCWNSYITNEGCFYGHLR